MLKDPPPSNSVLLQAERAAWAEISILAHQSVRNDALFWTRDVFDNTMLAHMELQRSNSSASGSYSPWQKGTGGQSWFPQNAAPYSWSDKPQWQQPPQQSTFCGAEKGVRGKGKPGNFKGF